MQDIHSPAVWPVFIEWLDVEDLDLQSIYYFLERN